jgi:hypothetical protein
MSAPATQKCWLTGKSVFFVRSLLCPFILLLNGWTLFPTYCHPVKEVNHIRCFAIDIAKDLILLSSRLAMEHLCMLQLETAFATLVTTWFTLADRQWRSRYRSSDQCILNAFRSPERYNGWFRDQLCFTFFNFFPTMPEIFSKEGWQVRTRGTRLLIFFSLYSRSFLLISLAFENPLSITLSLHPPSLQMMV